MDRFLFVFGGLVFFFSIVFFVMNLLTNYDGQALIISVFAMLNAAIAMGVSEILSVVKSKD